MTELINGSQKTIRGIDPVKLEAGQATSSRSRYSHDRSLSAVPTVFHLAMERLKRRACPDCSPLSSNTFPIEESCREACAILEEAWEIESSDHLNEPDLRQPRDARRGSLGSLQEYAHDRQVRVSRANRMSLDELMTRTWNPPRVGIDSEYFADFQSHRDLSKLADLNIIVSKNSVAKERA